MKKKPGRARTQTTAVIQTNAGDSTRETAVAPSDRPDRDRTRWANLNRPFAVGFFATLGGLMAIVLGIAITNLSTVIIYVVFALFAALGLDPVVRWLERRGISRPWGILIVCLGFGLVLVAVLLIVLPTAISQIAAFGRNLPQIISDFQDTEVYTNILNASGGVAADMLADAQDFILDPARLASIGGGVLQVGVSIATGISGLIIIFVLTLYFIASLSTMKSAFYKLLPARNRVGAAEITEEITDSIGGYLMGMVTLAFFNSVVAFSLHLFIGLPFPALMAVVAFFITLIPLVGSVLFWSIATTLALFTSPLAAIIFGICYLTYMQLEAYVLTPRVMNRAISVPGSLVVIGALVGGTLIGLLGALVAIPVTASVLLIIKKVLIPRQDAKV